MKYSRVSVRLDENTSMELQELCKKQEVSMSTMIRALLKRGIDEVRDKASSPQKTSS